MKTLVWQCPKCGEEFSRDLPLAWNNEDVLGWARKVSKKHDKTCPNGTISQDDSPGDARDE